jgi:Leucine-rich repeat (LRR) protein
MGAASLTPSDVRRANDLLSQRDGIVREFQHMTAGGKLPTLSEVVIRTDGQPSIPSYRWELVNLTNSIGIVRTHLERRIVVTILSLISEQIDEIDRQLKELGVQVPARPAVADIVEAANA